MDRKDERPVRRKRQIAREQLQSQDFEQVQQQIEMQKKREAKRIRTRRKMQKKRKQRRQAILVVIGFILILTGTYAGAKAYVKIKAWEDKAKESDFKPITVTANEPQKVDQEEKLINVAIFGTDEDGFRTDVNMLATFHTDTKEISLISVPRDTRVTLTDEMIAHLSKTNRSVPNERLGYGQCKFTELHAYPAQEDKCAFSVAMMEELLGVQVDYYIKFDISGFKDVVDAIGGVDFYVPQDMYWDMSDNGGITINLKEGQQTLNGAQAEQLVRFRMGYISGDADISRMKTQQEFIRAFMQKVCSTDTIISSANKLISVVLDNTESNITVSEALKYVQYVKDIKPSEMQTYTIPGELTRYNGASCIDNDAEGTKELVNRVVYGMESDEDVQDSNEGNEQGDESLYGQTTEQE